MKKILVIGSANADLVIHSKKLPALGETVIGGGFSVGAGGKGLNQAVAAKKLGGDVSFFAMLGSDSNGKMLKDRLEHFGIDFVGRETEGAPTGCAVITVVNGDNSIILDTGANSTLTVDVVDSVAELIAKADVVMMQYEIPRESIIRIAEIARANGTSVVVNPAPFMEMPKEFYGLVDLLVPNEYEARDITGVYPDDEESTKKALSLLCGLGVGRAVITLGERGCVYNDMDEAVFRPAIKTKAVDTTSAGDSFIGALCVKLSMDESFEDAIGYATRVSSITVSRAGASDSIPYAHELEK